MYKRINHKRILLNLADYKGCFGDGFGGKIRLMMNMVKDTLISILCKSKTALLIFTNCDQLTNLEPVSRLPQWIFTNRSIKKGNESRAWKLTTFQRLDFTCDDVLDSLKEENIIRKGGVGIVCKGVMPNNEHVEGYLPFIPNILDKFSKKS
ncbi:hypothetical protein LXL04_012036 [Taraxacum kok-saghyz]